MDEVTGFHWHVHHEELVEWCHSYKERADFIRTEKRSIEQELRLRLFKKVQGMLPNEVVKAGQAYDEAEQVLDKAEQVLDKAWQAYNKQAHDEAWQAYYKARQTFDKAWQPYDKARRAYNDAITNNMPAIIALHEKECTDCPWDGHTIFPNAA